jgi:hypothetical protein
VETFGILYNFGKLFQVAMAGKAAKSNSSGKIAENSASKRVIYIVAGDDGSHVPTLRQVKLHGEKVLEHISFFPCASVSG